MSKELTIEVIDAVGVTKDNNVIKPPRTTKEHYPCMHSTGDRVLIRNGKDVIGILSMCIDENGEVLNMSLSKI